MENNKCTLVMPSPDWVNFLNRPDLAEVYKAGLTQKLADDREDFILLALANRRRSDGWLESAAYFYGWYIATLRCAAKSRERREHAK